MPLLDIDLPGDSTPIPENVQTFLREAERRIEQFQQTSRSHGFVPSDYAGAYKVLRTISTASAAPGPQFCEWGSGFGVVASLASMVDFTACGIEIEEDLVSAARRLAADFELDVEFVRDSFIPPGGENCADISITFAWLTQEAGAAEEGLGLAIDDFDVIFAYPWPDEERVIEDLFDRYAAVGAVLVTYHGIEGFRVQRKSERRPRRNGRRRSPANGA
jgi:hypothetical protein